MNETNAKQLLEYLGVKNAELYGEWVRASCPFAFARHKHGKDTNPSFGIFHNPTGKSRFNCFGCNFKGPSLDKLVVEMQYYLQTKQTTNPSINLAKAYELIEDENVIGYHGAEWTGITVAEEKYEPWPNWFVEAYPEAWKVPLAVNYLKSRGVPNALWHSMSLRADTGKRMVGFPYWNRDGVLSGMRGRSWVKESKFPHYDYKWNGANNSKLVYLGEHHIDYLKPLVILEGEFDYASVYRVYRNVVSNLTASLSAQKVAKLENAVEIIGFFDDDEAGQIASKILADKFKGLYREVSYEPMKKYRDVEGELADPGACNHLQIAELLSPHVTLDALIE